MFNRLTKNNYEHYRELRKFASGYRFNPKLVATLMYYYKKSKITKRNLLNDWKITRKYLQYELQQVEKFYSNHLDFISYYNSGQTSFDQALFLRKNLDPSTIPTYILLYDDSDHTTNGDHLKWIKQTIRRRKQQNYKVRLFMDSSQIRINRAGLCTFL